MTCTTRFAPSPTGRLHLGHAYSALVAHDFARQGGGRFLLRMEDIDPTRCRPGFETGIREDLAWLGLGWEEPVRRQSEHLAEYAGILERLRERGVLYPCFCTRAGIAREVANAAHAPHGPDGVLYPGLCRQLGEGERLERLEAGHSHAWRLDVAEALRQTGTLSWREGDETVVARPELLGDVVLARKETPTSYHLAVTVDDHLQGVTHVIRGEDLYHASHVHRLLQALLGFPSPHYRHHPLLTGPDGRRYAKRDASLTLSALRAAGVTPDQVRQRVGLG